jgi:hypothetical protein
LFSHLSSKDDKVKIYKTIILPVVFYGCETWTLTVREEQKLRVFENRVLRGIFGPERDEVTGGWRKLHNEELHNLYSSPNFVTTVAKPGLEFKLCGDAELLNPHSSRTIMLR